MDRNYSRFPGEPMTCDDSLFTISLPSSRKGIPSVVSSDPVDSLQLGFPSGGGKGQTATHQKASTKMQIWEEKGPQGVWRWEGCKVRKNGSQGCIFGWWGG